MKRIQWMKSIYGVVFLCAGTAIRGRPTDL